MVWQNYAFIVYITAILWLIGMLGFFIFSKKRILRSVFLGIIIAGIIPLVYFIISLWVQLERPPFRTLAETRLWYSLFLSIVGVIIFLRWKLKWLLVYSLLLALLFAFINYLNPDTFDKTLMPALQSPWFVPHVIVYIFAYALLGVSSLIALKGLYLKYRNKQLGNTIYLADNIVYIGFAFLTFGLLFGALWAKDAWGHYWTWDPKETWAFITWLTYLLYIHFRVQHKHNVKFPLWSLALAFAFLLICWFGVNYLPSAQESVHTYSS